jgi:hypothetical protein
MAPTPFFAGDARSRDSSLSSPASLQHKDENLSLGSNESRDDSESSSQDELDIPDFVLDNFSKHGLAVTQQGLVYWKKGESQHPRDWNINRKLYDSFLVILFEFVA